MLVFLWHRNSRLVYKPHARELLVKERKERKKERKKNYP
jgi:hypothetical protein